MRNKLPLIFLILLTCFVSRVDGAFFDDYTFELIAESSNEFKAFLQPVLNNNGTVLFLAQLQNGRDAIYVSDGNSTQKVADYEIGSVFSHIGDYPFINDNGTVHFLATRRSDKEVGIFAWKNGTVEPIITQNSPMYSGFSNPTSNNNEAVATEISRPDGFQGIYRVQDDTITPIAEEGPDFRGFPSVVSPPINDNGTVAFIAELAPYPTGAKGVFVGSGGSVSTIATLDESFNQFFPLIAINDEGKIVFGAELDDGGTGIFLWENGNLTTIADNSGIFSHVGQPALNNLGLLITYAELDDGTAGLFGGFGSLDYKLLDNSELLFGRQWHSADVRHGGINDNGQVAFRVSYGDGTWAIFRADPPGFGNTNLIPEPSTLLLLGTGLLGLSFLRRTK